MPGKRKFPSGSTEFNLPLSLVYNVSELEDVGGGWTQAGSLEEQRVKRWAHDSTLCVRLQCDYTNGFMLGGIPGYLSLGKGSGIGLVFEVGTPDSACEWKARGLKESGGHKCTL